MTEAALRDAMVRTCRAMAARGLTHGTSGNLSARLGDDMLITPSAVPWGRMAPADIVRMPVGGGAGEQGVEVPGKGGGVEAGPGAGGAAGGRPSTEWRMHAEILRARPDAGAVLHAHSMFATTLACLHREIPSFHYMIAVAGGDTIRCAPYATFGTPELARHAVTAIEGRRACLLGNHGLVSLGSSPAAALELAEEVENLAAQYWRALQVGEPKLLSSYEMAAVHERFREYRVADPVGPATDRDEAAGPPDLEARPPRERAPAPASTASAVAGATAAAGAGRAARSGGRGERAPGGPSDLVGRAARVDWADLGQRWIGRVGALLLLVGLAYLMKFAVDQGWFGPPLRIAFGALTGLALLATGLRLESGRRTYALTLLGTGVATLYLTGYASYALYGYLGPRTAFAALAAATALALVLARRREEQLLAQIGAAGAFATPLLLGEAGGATALSLYLVVVTGWTGALAFLFGWRALFFTILAGAFWLLSLAVEEAPPADAVAVSAAGAWVWLVVAALPMLRERGGAGVGMYGRAAVPGPLRSRVSDPAVLDQATLTVLIPLATLLAVIVQGRLWDLERAGAAGVAFVAVAVTGALLLGPETPRLARTRVCAAFPVLLVYLGATLLVPDDALRIALLAVGGALAFLAPAVRRAWGTEALGHVIFALVASWFLDQLDARLRPVGFFTPIAAAEVTAVVTAVVVALRGLDGDVRRGYLLGAHLALLLWVVVCARGLAGALGWVSVLWGAYGAALMVLAAARNLARVRLAALATLGLVAGKLLLLDTAGVAAGWRIVLFIGFGAAFLALGYISSPDES